MLACNTLRIDHYDGSAVADYRIEDDCVESRTLCTATEGSPDTEKSVATAQTRATQLSRHA
jgi:hypothetical protein